MSKRKEIEALADFMLDDEGLSQDEVRADLRSLGITKEHVASTVQQALRLVAEAKRQRLTEARRRMEVRAAEERRHVPPDMPRAEVIAQLSSMPGVEAFFRSRSEDETSTEELRRILEDYWNVERGNE
jgi:hypothetical protein